VLTSLSPQEGKTTVASNLAIALAAINHRVVLIDADLRKPRLHEIFGLDNESGLSTCLTSSSPSAAMARNRTIPNLTVITSGPPSLDATSLLHSPRVKELLENLRKDYDMVLLDTPPMLQMSDARVLGRLADGVIIVTRAGHTNRDDVVAARQRFAQDGTPVLGTILNDWNPRSARHGHYGYGKGYYQ
jgi:capsular exopolysaccharide synthesis family protein